MLLFDAAAILGSILALGIAVHASRQRSFGLGCLALWMLTIAACAWLVVLQLDESGRLTPLARLLLPLLSTPAGPLLYGYVLYTARRQQLHWAWFLPFAIHLAAAGILGYGLNRWIGLSHVIWLEYLFLLMAWVVWARSGFARSERIASGFVLAAATLLHFANAAQTLAFYGLIEFTRFVRHVPFVVLCMWSVAAIGFALIESPTFRRLAPRLAPAAGAADRALYERMSQKMQAERPWSDPDFDVNALARLLGTHANAVSRALSRAGETTFYDYVNGFRVREAQRLLADPRESRFKIEALGRQAGFRARSTFFKLFRQHTGLTPSEYRAARNGSLDG